MQVRVRVKAGAAKDAVTLLKDGRLAVSVRAKAKDGEANARVIELVARHFKTVPGNVRIARGQTTPSKLLVISG